MILLVVRPGPAIGSVYSVNYGSLAVIASLLIASKAVYLSGLTNQLAVRMLRLTGGGPRTIYVLIIVTYIVSPLIMNDGAVLILVPLAMVLADTLGYDPALLVVLTTISANIGSTLLPIGNPQDIILWIYYDIDLTAYMGLSITLYTYSLVLLITYTWLISGRGRGSKTVLPRVKLDKRLALASILSLVFTIVFVETEYPLLTLPLTITTLLLTKPRVLRGIDYPLIIIFYLMFLDTYTVAKLVTIPNMLGPWETFIGSITLSQIVSNVPATLVFIHYTVYWKQLFFGVNIGGVGFITGSLANIIAIRISRTSLWKYHVYSLPYFILLAILTALILYYIC